MKNILKDIIFILLYILSIFIRQRNIIIIGGPDKNRYGGNVKYLYEFLSKNTEYQVFWLTESDDIITYLKNKNLKYLSNKNYFKKLITTISCKYVIDSGTNFYNPFNYISRMKNIVKITTMHGSGPKLTLGNNKDYKRRILSLFDSVCFCTEYTQQKIGVEEFMLDKNVAKIFGQPKHDILRDDKYVESIYSKRDWCNKILNKESSNQYRIIYYCPTWREKKSSLPLEHISNFSLDKFNDFLKTHDIYFLYTEHMLSNFSKLNKSYSNIKKVNQMDYPLFDNLELLIESDMMVADYSTLSSDYSILNRPQLFVVTDLEEISLKKGFIENPINMMPGPIIEEYAELCKYILKYIKDPKLYVKDYQDQLSELKTKYVGPKTLNSRKILMDYILSR